MLLKVCYGNDSNVGTTIFMKIFNLEAWVSNHDWWVLGKGHGCVCPRVSQSMNWLRTYINKSDEKGLIFTTQYHPDIAIFSKGY